MFLDFSQHLRLHCPVDTCQVLLCYEWQDFFLQPESPQTAMLSKLLPCWFVWSINRLTLLINMTNSHMLWNRLAIWKDIQKSSVTPNSQNRDFMPIILGKQNKTKPNKPETLKMYEKKWTHSVILYFSAFLSKVSWQHLLQFKFTLTFVKCFDSKILLDIDFIAKSRLPRNQWNMVLVMKKHAKI